MIFFFAMNWPKQPYTVSVLSGNVSPDVFSIPDMLFSYKYKISFQMKIISNLDHKSDAPKTTCVYFTETVAQTWANNFIKTETLVQVFSCEFCEISKNNFSYRTPAVATSDFIIFRI